MKHILVESIDKETVIIGFINSSNELEYTIYKAFDGGVIDSDNTDLGSLLAAEEGLTDYIDYDLVMKQYKVGDFVTFYEGFEIAGDFVAHLDNEWEKAYKTCDVTKQMLEELDMWEDNQIASIDEDGDFKFEDFGYTWPIEVIKGLAEDQRKED